MRYVQTYLDNRAPTYADDYDVLVRAVQADPDAWAARARTAPVSDAELDAELSAELARWEVYPLLALSVAEITAGLSGLSDRELRQLLDAESLGRGRSTALAAIGAARRKLVTR